MNDSLRSLLDSIRSVDVSLSDRARAHLDELTKPRGSLGVLEDVARRLFLMAGGQTPLRVDPPEITA